MDTLNFNLFNVSLTQFSLKFDYKKLANHINNIEKQQQGRIVSNIGGWQSDPMYSDSEKIYDDMLNEINENLKTITLKNNFNDNLICKVTNFWVNVNYKNNANKEHWHPGSTYSGVVYIEVPENSGNIEFINPAMDLMNGSDFDFEYFKKPVDSSNAKTWVLNAVEGTMIIFPSYLKHYVLYNNSNMRRISIAFNTKIFKKK